MKRALSALTLLILLTAPAIHAQVAAGGEFAISTSSGARPSVAADARGNFVVAWMANDDGSFGGVNARRYDAAGNALGLAFQVNTYTTGHQGNEGPAIAVDASGDVVIVWYSFGDFGQPSQDGSDSGIYAQRYRASGAPAGSEFRVNTFTTDNQAKPSVASDAAGNFVVAWWSAGQDGSGQGIFAQRHDAFGAPRGSEFRVNTYTSGNQRNPSVACDAAGNFIVVWASTGPVGTSTAITGQRFDNAGAVVGGEFEVSTATTFLSAAAVAAHPDGSFVVIWSGPDANGTGVFARKYDASGVPVGGQVQVNTEETGFQGAGAVALDEAGRFVVTWNSADPPPQFIDRVRVRRFDATAVPREPEFQPAPDRRAAPGVASDSTGNFVVVWDQVYGTIAGQRFGGLVPALSRVDSQPTTGSDGNEVLEPGEAVEVMPFWRNVNGAAQTFGGSTVAFSGPPAPGVAYQLPDAVGVYGTVPNGTTAPCSDCYRVGVSFGGMRPATHWDATFEERLTPDALGQTKHWRLHMGESFTDVPRSSVFYRFVEALLHHSVTSGCTATAYCTASATSREQMAVFVLVAREGAGYAPPACGATPRFADVPASSPFCPWIEELARRGVVAGCQGGNYCPASSVSREQMAVFVLRTLDPALVPPACATPVFADVPASNSFCPWIEELFRRGVVTGCGGGNYCPAAFVTREQMGVFISATFGLTLYGP